jgi:uroporphyrinogen decarboxylase
VQFLDVLADMIGHYGCHQIECGVQVIQVFELWSHFLSPREFELWAKPTAQKAIQIKKQKYPETPVIYFANGGSSYLELQLSKNKSILKEERAFEARSSQKE